MTESSEYEGVSSSSSSPADCRYGIELTREVSRYNVPGRAQAWRMRVTVTRAYNVDFNIFVYLRRQATADQPERDTFESVASPVDLDEYPAGAPGTEEPRFFRMAEVDLVARSRELIDKTWELIKEDRNELIRTLVGICELEYDATDSFGYLPD